MGNTLDTQKLTATLGQAQPPDGLNPLLQALWWDAQGNWARAHAIAQEIETPDAAWVHAYLHRKEGDDWNAGYWYRRSGRPHCRLPLEAEWREMVAGLSQ
jgi:hypothetical protein